MFVLFRIMAKLRELQNFRGRLQLIVAILALVFVAASLIRMISDRSGGGSDSAESRKTGQVKRAIIISVDGLRPDLLLRANTPVMKGLMSRGSYTMWARTTEMSITLPSHTSMLTGVTPEYHGLLWNYYIENVYPDVPTIFDLAHKAGYKTALISGKTKFNELARPGSVNWSEIYWDKPHVGPDLAVGESAADILRRHRPDLLFMHLAQVDETGHAIGWATPQQIQAIERADQAIGKLMDALRETGLEGSTLIIISADHGGQGKVHGPNDPRSRHIPWIAVGPGIRKNYDLTRDASLVVNTEDTFATACYLLHIPVPKKIDGKFVKQIMEKSETKKTMADTGKELLHDFNEDELWEPAPYKYEWERMEPGHR